MAWQGWAWLAGPGLSRSGVAGQGESGLAWPVKSGRVEAWHSKSGYGRQHQQRGIIMSFEWKAGSRFPVKAETAGRELERIAAENDGELRPPDVVEASRPEEAPLHPCFTWDDREAAELYRCVEARHVIRSIVVQPDQDDQPARLMYVSVVPSSGERAYVDTAVVMSDAALREQALADALSELAAWQRRNAHLTELADIFAAIEHNPVIRKRARAKRRTEVAAATP